MANSILALVVILALLAVSHADVSPKRHVQFESWMRQYGKSYGTIALRQQKELVWNQNMDFIESWDAKARGFEVGMNQFGDLTNAEITAMYAGLRLDVNSLPRNDAPRPNAAQLLANPSSVDWVAKGVVNPIKNQGQCGSCWAFSSVASLESEWAINYGTLLSLSEQQLVDCTSAYGNYGCNGGLMEPTFTYIRQYGIELNSSYQYTASDGTCKYQATLTVADCNGYKTVTRNDEKSLEHHVANDGVIAVAVDAGLSSFHFYKSGIYYDAACSAARLNHAVNAVGYGADSGGHKYWYIRNSWGTTWGMNGYMYLAKDKNNACGVASMASFPTLPLDKAPKISNK